MDFQQSVGPDGGFGAGNGGANGPSGGTNGGDYVSSDGSDQYGYGGTGSLFTYTSDNIKQDGVGGLSNLSHVTYSAIGSGTFVLDASAGYH